LVLENFTQLKSIDIIKHYEYEIGKSSHLIGKTVQESKFWQNTGATIIGIKRGSDVFVSAGPLFSFLEYDTIIFVGTEDVKTRVKNYSDSLQ
jgi:K+/H+ antiporter YhaU regulatory subunit KhtT